MHATNGQIVFDGGGIAGAEFGATGSTSTMRFCTYTGTCSASAGGAMTGVDAKELTLESCYAVPSDGGDVNTRLVGAKTDSGRLAPFGSTGFVAVDTRSTR